MKAIVIEEMLEYACPSIQLRLRKEILGETVSAEEYAGYQSAIEADPLVQEAWGWAGEVPWWQTTFHGYESIEAAIRIFCEKGLDPQHPYIQSALAALEAGGKALLMGIGKPGIYLDEANLGGSEMIRAYLFTRAGQEGHVLVQPQMEKTLAAFKYLNTMESLEQVYIQHKDQFIFQAGAILPSIYHVRLLAYSQSWRNAENMALVREGIRKMVSWSPIPDIYLKVSGQLVAPGSFSLQNFKVDPETLQGYGWMLWLHRMEMLNRLGVLDGIPEMATQKAWLQGELDVNDGWFTRKWKHSSFAKWGAYSGLRLEADWRTAKRRMYDLTFRAGLIKR